MQPVRAPQCITRGMREVAGVRRTHVVGSVRVRALGHEHFANLRVAMPRRLVQRGHPRAVLAVHVHPAHAQRHHQVVVPLQRRDVQDGPISLRAAAPASSATPLPPLPGFSRRGAPVPERLGTGFSLVSASVRRAETQATYPHNPSHIPTARVDLLRCLVRLEVQEGNRDARGAGWVACAAGSRQRVQAAGVRRT